MTFGDIIVLAVLGLIIGSIIRKWSRIRKTERAAAADPVRAAP